jgi:hypothetical protein
MSRAAPYFFILDRSFSLSHRQAPGFESLELGLRPLPERLKGGGDNAALAALPSSSSDEIPMQ